MSMTPSQWQSMTLCHGRDLNSWATSSSAFGQSVGNIPSQLTLTRNTVCRLAPIYPQADSYCKKYTRTREQQRRHQPYKEPNVRIGGPFFYGHCPAYAGD